MSKRYDQSKQKEDRQMKEIRDTAQAAERDRRSQRSSKSTNNAGKSSSECKPKGKRSYSGKTLNDPSFYNSYTEYSQEAGKLAFGTPVGSVGTIMEGYNFAIPGLMSIQFIPTIGVSTDFTSPINRSSIHYWTQLRSIQKASAAYDHQDVTMMLLAMDSCFMFHELMAKAYGVMKTFNPLNVYYPRAVIASMGFSFNDLLQNLDDFRAYINQFAYNCGQYAMPSDVWLFDRHRELIRNITLDSQTNRAQSYSFVPSGFWQYDNTVTTGSQLTWKSWLGDEPTAVTIHTFAEVVAFGNALLNAISNDTDFSYISGDMLALYGPNSVHKLDYIPDGYTVLPTYSQEMMSQIENMTIMGEWLSTYTPVITQNPSVNQGAIIFNPVFTAKENSEEVLGSRLHNFINMHIEHPTSDDVLVATRLMTDHYVGGGGTMLKSCGTEVVEYVQIWERNVSTGAFREIYIDSNAIVSHFVDETAASIIGDLQKASRLSQFDWHPIITRWARQSDQSNWEWCGFIGDVDNFAALPNPNLDRLHEAALFSLFDVRNSAQKAKSIGPSRP